MAVEVVTKEDLEIFRLRLLDDLKKLFPANATAIKKEWLRSHEVRKLLKISPNTLVSLRAEGKLRPVKLGGILYYSQGEIDRMFDNAAKK